MLEAVIGAVDARLREQAGQMDRRLADLEARLAVAQNVQEQDRQTTAQLREETAAAHTAVQQDVRRVLAGQTATQNELQLVRQQQERIVDAAERRFADVRQEYRLSMAELRNEMEQSIEARFITAAAANAAAKIEEQVAPLRAAIEQKEQELVELRRRLATAKDRCSTWSSRLAMSAVRRLTVWSRRVNHSTLRAWRRQRRCPKKPQLRLRPPAL
ncbi:MAG: hypothetical protein WDO73_08420 [Ignavibacteriota bacterium]